MDLQRLTSHPVHLVDPDGNLNPTALVPFCSVSNDYSAMGKKINQIDVPVCNSFGPKMVKDQLCYTVDLNEMINRNELKEKVFDFFIDYNEEREVSIAADDNAHITGNIIIETLGIHFILSYLKSVTP